MTAVSAEAQVLRVVQDNNRPYGLQNIVDLTAHLGLKKAAVTKALDALVEQGKVTAKDFGKTKIFIPVQAGLQVLSKEDAEAQKAKCRELQQQLQKEAAECKEVEQGLAALRNAPTEEQVLQQIAEAKKELQELQAKLVGLRSGATLVKPEERAAVLKRFTANLDAWRRRRTMFRDIWDGLAEGLEGKQADLFEEIGVETDESVGVSYADAEKLTAKKRKF